MNVLFKPIVMFFLLVAAGCATVPSIYSVKTLAIVEKVETSTSYTEKGSQMIAAGGIYLNVPTTEEVQTYIYLLNIISSGDLIRTKSSLVLKELDCVEFHHGLFINQQGSGYNFIDGILKKSSLCE